jgi:hypothetical protein
MPATPPTSIRQLREGKIALAVRIIVAVITIAGAFHGPYNSIHPGMYYFDWTAAIFGILLNELIITVPIWICKLIQYALTRRPATPAHE